MLEHDDDQNPTISLLSGIMQVLVGVSAATSWLACGFALFEHQGTAIAFLLVTVICLGASVGIQRALHAISGGASGAVR